MRKEQIITTNNNQMEEKGMKSRFIHFKKRFVPALSGALMGVMLMSTTCKFQPSNRHLWRMRLVSCKQFYFLNLLPFLLPPNFS